MAGRGRLGVEYVVETRHRKGAIADREGNAACRRNSTSKFSQF
jgi:hypothetical protein